MQQEYISVHTYMMHTRPFVYNYNSVFIMCRKMAGTDATPSVAMCTKTDPSIYVFLVTNTWGSLTRGISWYVLERSSLEMV